MREYDCTVVPESLLTAETMDLLSAVHEARGRQSPNLSVRQDVLTALAEVARAQSTEVGRLLRCPWGELRRIERRGNDYGPFVRYMLGVVLVAYRDLEERVGESLTVTKGVPDGNH